MHPWDVWVHRAVCGDKGHLSRSQGPYSAISPLILALQTSRSWGGTLKPEEITGAWGMGSFEAGVALGGVSRSQGTQGPHIPTSPLNKGSPVPAQDCSGRFK